MEELCSDNIPVKGRLKQHAQFWYTISSSRMVISVITEGYKIPFTAQPHPMFYRNNNSANKEYQFVTETVLDLLKSKRITEKHEPSYVVSPLSVAYQAS